MQSEMLPHLDAPDAPRLSRRLRRLALRQLRRFARDEGGVMVVFSLFIMIMILMVGGIGVDTMRFEMERTRLQNTIDRAVLAAADLDQTLDAKTVVRD